MGKQGGNRTKRTPKKEGVFLEALREGCSVYVAAQAAGVARSCVYRWREANPEFAKQWDDAVEAGTDLLEQEAKRRAHKGVLKPVYYRGEVVGQIREYSDTLLIFLLKGKRPKQYRDSVKMAVGGDPDAPPVKYEDARTTLTERIAGIAARIAKGKGLKEPE